MVDAAPAWIRYSLALGGEVGTLLSVIGIFIVFNLFIVPDQTNPSFSIDWISALAGRVIRYDALSTFNNTSLALIILNAHWIVSSMWNAKHGRLTFISVNVFAKDEIDPRLDAVVTPVIKHAMVRMLKCLGADHDTETI